MNNEEEDRGLCKHAFKRATQAESPVLINNGKRLPHITLELGNAKLTKL